MASLSETFTEGLRKLINQHSRENESDTPDYILANYMNDCLNAYEKSVRLRDAWFQVDMWADDKRSEQFHAEKNS